MVERVVAVVSFDGLRSGVPAAEPFGWVDGALPVKAGVCGVIAPGPLPLICVEFDDCWEELTVPALKSGVPGMEPFGLAVLLGAIPLVEPVTPTLPGLLPVMDPLVPGELTALPVFEVEVDPVLSRVVLADVPPLRAPSTLLPAEDGA